MSYFEVHITFKSHDGNLAFRCTGYEAVDPTAFKYTFDEPYDADGPIAHVNYRRDEVAAVLINDLDEDGEYDEDEDDED